jgi:pimeloyl-ACP methyl ester carboxylesterase
LDVKQIESWDVSYDGTQSMHRTDDGIELYYEYRGEGPWLVILTGGFVVSTIWRNFTQRLVESNTVLTYDMRNQGASSMGDGAYANHLSDLKSLLDGLGVEQAYILGVSFSTLFARDFVAENPDRARGLIQCAPAISPYGSKRRDYMLKAWLAALEAGGPAALFDATYPFVVGDRTIARGGSATYLALRDRFLAVNSKAQLQANIEGALQADDDPDKLRRLECPVLLFTGDNDFNMCRSVLEDQAALMPDARVEIIERCGHSPYVEAPEAFESIIEKFIAEVEDRESGLKAD